MHSTMNANRTLNVCFDLFGIVKIDVHNYTKMVNDELFVLDQQLGTNGSVQFKWIEKRKFVVNFKAPSFVERITIGCNGVIVSHILCTPKFIRINDQYDLINEKLFNYEGVCPLPRYKKSAFCHIEMVKVEKPMNRLDVSMNGNKFTAMFFSEKHLLFAKFEGRDTQKKFEKLFNEVDVQETTQNEPVQDEQVTELTHTRSISTQTLTNHEIREPWLHFAWNDIAEEVESFFNKPKLVPYWVLHPEWVPKRKPVRSESSSNYESAKSQIENEENSDDGIAQFFEEMGRE